MQFPPLDVTLYLLLNTLHNALIRASVTFTSLHYSICKDNIFCILMFSVLFDLILCDMFKGDLFLLCTYSITSSFILLYLSVPILLLLRFI